jgi:hypothetical protein
MADPVSVYPDAIDGYAQLPLAVDKITPVDAYTVNSLRSAIINIENELGVSPKGIYSSIKERLDNAGGGGTAATTTYDNLTSGLVADNVQDAIDELSAATPSGVVLDADFSAKGSILIGTAAGAKTSLALGVDTYLLSADSTEPSGVKWTPAPPSTDLTAIHTDGTAEVNGLTAKAIGVAADEFVIEDSAALYVKKKLTMSGIRITESQITDLTHTDSDAIHDNVAGEINVIASKAAGVAGDLFIIEDSADSNNKKSLLMSAIRITQSQVTDLVHTDTDAFHSSTASEISVLTAKSSVASGDIFLAEDSADSNNKKKILFSTISAALASMTVSAESSSPVTITSADVGTAYTNEGATVEITFNLPTAAAGLIYSFVCQDSDLLNVTAAAGDTIRMGSQVTITAGSITATAIGDSVTLVAINSTEWMALGGFTGVWDVETS